MGAAALWSEALWGNAGDDIAVLLAGAVSGDGAVLLRKWLEDEINWDLIRPQPLFDSPTLADEEVSYHRDQSDQEEDRQHSYYHLCLFWVSPGDELTLGTAG